MPPKKKKRSAEAIIVAPTRRSTRARRPSRAAAAAANEGSNSNDSLAQTAVAAARDSKAALNNEASITVAPQDEVVVHRPREITAAAAAAAPLPATPMTVKTTSIPSGRSDDDKDEINGSGEKAASTTEGTITILSDESAEDYDMDHNDAAADDESEDKIVATHPSSPKAATRTPVKIIKKLSRQYVKIPAAGEEEDELMTEQPAIKIVKVSDSGRKSRSKYDKPEEMLTNPRSPLVNARLRVRDFFPLLPPSLFFFSSSFSFLP